MSCVEVRYVDYSRKYNVVENEEFPLTEAAISRPESELDSNRHTLGKTNLDQVVSMGIQL